MQHDIPSEASRPLETPSVVNPTSLTWELLPFSFIDLRPQLAALLGLSVEGLERLIEDCDED